MGGNGSTRWLVERVKWTVEACVKLDVWELAKKGALVDGRSFTGAYESTRLNRPMSGVTTGDTCRLRIGDESMQLVAWRHPFGYVRWYAVCNGCGERCRMLYVPPPFSGRFRCRRCHRLTYRSQQESDKRVYALLRNPAAMQAAMASSNIKLAILGLKAWSKVTDRIF